MTIPWLSLTAQAQDHTPHSQPSTAADLFNRFSVVFLYARNSEVPDTELVERIGQSCRTIARISTNQIPDSVVNPVIAHPSIESGYQCITDDLETSHLEENTEEEDRDDRLLTIDELQHCYYTGSHRQNLLFQLFLTLIVCFCHLNSLNM